MPGAEAVAGEDLAAGRQDRLLEEEVLDGPVVEAQRVVPRVGVDHEVEGAAGRGQLAGGDVPLLDRREERRIRPLGREPDVEQRERRPRRLVVDPRRTPGRLGDADGQARAPRAGRAAGPRAGAPTAGADSPSRAGSSSSAFCWPLSGIGVGDGVKNGNWPGWKTLSGRRRGVRAGRVGPVRRLPHRPRRPGQRVGQLRGRQVLAVGDEAHRPWGAGVVVRLDREREVAVPRRRRRDVGHLLADRRGRGGSSERPGRDRGDVAPRPADHLGLLTLTFSSSLPPDASLPVGLVLGDHRREAVEPSPDLVAERDLVEQDPALGPRPLPEVLPRGPRALESRRRSALILDRLVGEEFASDPARAGAERRRLRSSIVAAIRPRARSCRRSTGRRPGRCPRRSAISRSGPLMSGVTRTRNLPPLVSLASTRYTLPGKVPTATDGQPTNWTAGQPSNWSRTGSPAWTSGMSRPGR